MRYTIEPNRGNVCHHAGVPKRLEPRTHPAGRNEVEESNSQDESKVVFEGFAGLGGG